MPDKYYPEGVTSLDHMKHDMKMGRFPNQSSVETFLKERAVLAAQEEVAHLPGGSQMPDANTLMQSDLRELLLVLGISDHARPQSPHDVFQEALGILRQRLASVAEMRAALAALVEDVHEHGPFVPDASLDRAERSLRDIFIAEDEQ